MHGDVADGGVCCTGRNISPGLRADRRVVGAGRSLEGFRADGGTAIDVRNAGERIGADRRVVGAGQVLGHRLKANGRVVGRSRLK